MDHGPDKEGLSQTVKYQLGEPVSDSDDIFATRDEPNALRLHSRPDAAFGELVPGVKMTGIEPAPQGEHDQELHGAERTITQSVEQLGQPIDQLLQDSFYLVYWSH